MSKEINIKNIAIQKIMIAVQRSISMSELANIEKQIMFEDCLTIFGDRIVATLIAYCYGKESERIVVHVKYPINWWEAVKERWFPTKYLKRHPIKYKTIDIDRPIYETFCPHLRSDKEEIHLQYLSKIRL